MALREVAPGTGTGGDQPAKVDIVAVHGLNPLNNPDHAFDTWRKPSGEGGRLWLRDLLPKCTPHARIYIYKYNSSPLFGADKERFAQRANDLLERLFHERSEDETRPLILIGHSLGGILIKQALVNAHNNRRYNSIKESTTGVVFFGTPHAGGKDGAAVLGSACIRIARGLFRDPPNDIMQALTGGSLFTDVLQENWRHQLNLFKIVSFYEGLNEIVSRDSATLGLPGDIENQVKLDATHGDMCRFDESIEEDMDIYYLVERNIDELYRAAVRRRQDSCYVKRNRRGDGKRWLEPRNRTSTDDERALIADIVRVLDPVDFQEELDQREVDRCPETGNWILGNDAFVNWTACENSSILFICGSPGSGKTFLVSNLMAQLREGHLYSDSASMAGFFGDNKIEGLSKRSTESIFKTFTAQLLEGMVKSTPDIVRSELQALSKPRKKSETDPLTQIRPIFRRLLRRFATNYIILDALDECDDWKTFLKEMTSLLRAAECRIKLVISSRNAATIPHLVSKIPALYRLDINPEVMKSDIERFVDWRIQTTDVRDLGTDEIARDTLIEGSQGLFLLARLRFNMLEDEIIPQRTELKAAIRELPRDVHIYYERALSRLNDADLAVARMVFLWVVFAQSPLSVEELVEAINVRAGSTTLRETGRLGVTSLELLFSGLTVVIGNRLELAHATVKEFVVSRVWDASNPGNFESQKGVIHSDLALTCITYLSNPALVACTNSSYTSSASFDDKWPLLCYASKHWISHLLSSTPTSPEIAREVLTFVESDGALAWWRHYSTGIPYYNWWAISMLSSQFTAWTHRNEAVCLSLAPGYDVVTDMREQNAAVLRATGIEEGHRVYLRTLAHLAGDRISHGRYRDGEKLLEEVLDLNERSQTLEVSEMLDAVGDLCWAQEHQGRFAEAKGLAEKRLTLCKLHQGENHRDTINATASLGGLLYLQRHLQESERLLRGAYSASQQVLGSEDPDTLAVRSMLSLVCQDTGDFIYAEELLDLELFMKVLGMEHPSTLTAMGNFAHLRYMQGKLGDAIALREKAVSLHRIIKGPNSDDTINSETLLARYYSDNRELTRAGTLQSELVGSASRWLDPSNPSVLHIQTDLASTRRLEGRLGEAIGIEERVLTEMHRRFGDAHPWTLLAVENFAVTRNKQGFHAEAEQHFLKVYNTSLHIWGEEHPNTQHVLRSLSLNKAAQGRFSEAEQLQSRSLQVARRMFGESHRTTLCAMGDYAITIREMGRTGEAEEMQRHVLRVRRDFFGEENSSYLTTLSSLAITNRCQGKLTTAECMEEHVLRARRTLSRDPDATLIALENLAVTKEKLGKQDEEEKLREDAWEISTNEFGENSSQALKALASLARIRIKQGRLGEAEEMDRRVLESERRLSGEDSPAYLEALANLARTKYERRQLKEAREMEERILKMRKMLASGEDPNVWNAMENLAQTESELGNLQAAEKLRQHVLDARVKFSGEHTLTALIAMANLALAKSDLGKLAEAERMQNYILELRQKLNGEDSTEVLTALESLAITKRGLGRVGEAEQMHQHVLDIRLRASGGENPKVLTAKAFLAHAKCDLGKVAEAEELERQVLQSRQRLSGEDDPSVLAAMTSLASTRRALGRLKDAEDMEQHVLEASRRIYDENHPDVLRAMANLALTRVEQGRLPEAEEMQTHILKTRLEAVGEDSHDTLAAMSALAATKRDQYQFVDLAGRGNGMELGLWRSAESLKDALDTFEADKLQEKVLERRKRVGGAENPLALSAAQTLAYTKARLGKYTEAEKLQQPVLEANSEILGDASPVFWESLCWMAFIKEEQRKLNEAEELLLHACVLRRRYASELNHSYRITMESLGDIQRKLHKFHEAEQTFNGMFELWKEGHGDQSNGALIAQRNLAFVKLDQNKFTEAEQAQNILLQVRRKIAKDDDPTVLAALDDLAKTKANLGKLNEAEEIQRRLMHSWKAIRSDTDPKTLEAAKGLAVTLGRLGRYKEAEDLGELILGTRSTTYPEDSASVLGILGDLAEYKKGSGKLGEAEQIQQRVVDSWKNLVGETSMETLDAMNHLAQIQQKLGKLEEAEQMLELILEKVKGISGGRSQQATMNMWTLALVKEEAGKLDEAARIGREVLEIDSSDFRQDCPELLTSLWNLAIIEFKRGKLGEADGLLQRVLVIRQNNPADDHPDIPTVLETIALCRSNQRILPSPLDKPLRRLYNPKDGRSRHTPFWLGHALRFWVGRTPTPLKRLWTAHRATS